TLQPDSSAALTRYSRNELSSPFATLAWAAVTQLLIAGPDAPSPIVISHCPACTRFAPRASVALSASTVIESTRDALIFFIQHSFGACPVEKRDCTAHSTITRATVRYRLILLDRIVVDSGEPSSPSEADWALGPLTRRSPRAAGGSRASSCTARTTSSRTATASCQSCARMPGVRANR